MHILITGGTGFIGSKLAKYFLDQKYKVTILSRNIKNILPSANIITNLEQHIGYLKDIEKIREPLPLPQNTKNANRMLRTLPSVTSIYK